MQAYSRCMWMNLRWMVIFQVSTFQRSIFALLGSIREAFGSFKAISRKIFTSGSRLLCFTQNDHTGQTGFKICPFFKVSSINIANPSIDGAKLHRFSELLIPFDAFLSLLMLFYAFLSLSIPFDAFLPKKCVCKQVIWHQ